MRSLAFPNSASGATAKPLNGNHGKKSVLVTGNPSADLDSFISAVTTSYFYNLKSNSKHSRNKTFIPILDLPSVTASDLWRLRPEFGVAIRQALGESADTITQSDPDSQGRTPVLENLITIGDIKNDSTSPLHNLFVDSTTPGQHQTVDQNEKQPLFLVDHNTPSIPGLSDEQISTRFIVQSCIDHHVDEDFVSQDAKPRIITTGIGSCTSLVVKHLRDEGLWPTASSEEESQTLQELSKLALASILIDTQNLKGQGDKCSDTDREVVKFLESIINAGLSSQASTASKTKWDRATFKDTISTAKSESLNLLSMQEIFDRDYKSWTETTTSAGGKSINIGISSLVRPTSWLVKHAGGIDTLIEEIEKFAMREDQKLGVFCLLTRTGDGRKEVLVVSFEKDVGEVIAEFEKRSEELKLEQWNGDKALMEALRGKFTGEQKCWFMGDTSKSRKQVGPLLRESVRNL
jgi:exopolyphosphatase